MHRVGSIFHCDTCLYRPCYFCSPNLVAPSSPRPPLPHRFSTHATLRPPNRNLFLVTNATDVAWAVNVADDVRQSIMSEAAAVEEEYGQPNGTREQEVEKRIATLSVKVCHDDAPMIPFPRL